MAAVQHAPQMLRVLSAAAEAPSGPPSAAREALMEVAREVVQGLKAGLAAPVDGCVTDACCRRITSRPSMHCHCTVLWTVLDPRWRWF